MQTLTSHTGRSARSDVFGELKPSDALRLEVHRAVDADVGSGALAALPPYIARPDGVDSRLRRMVAQSANGSRLVMVEGGSSTGKTRACWEAVRAELSSWRIVHPLAPDRPAALLRALQDDVLEPHTVLWLNEAQLYFLVKDYTAQVSSALRALLTDSQRGPVLVLGTMWPTYWNHLADDPAEGDELHDGMGAVHQLVDLALTITMPPAFNARELADAAALVASDPPETGSKSCRQRTHHSVPGRRPAPGATIRTVRWGCSCHPSCRQGPAPMRTPTTADRRVPTDRSRWLYR
ncbi:hypothetical protein OG258_53270 [Streptomyces mirabilis]|uniref:hypothetical protein n=1 Tax=Streptomyces mirabilis TaxID=68239 RepID=UPI002E2828D8|nr:hypothetical protein [Streptomyces mirabilis]